MTTFAERLKNAMEQANMSQSALSEQAGASKAAISQYLSGKNTPGPDRIKALADATGVSFDYLMGYGAAPVAEPPIKKISVKEAARCMGKSDQFVRIGLQRGLLPFGNAVPGTGACWNYYIVKGVKQCEFPTAGLKSLIDNGQAQSPSWNAYNPDALTLGGVTTGTNAGTYTATFTPKGRYKWADGTQTAKEVTWTINAATMTIPTQSNSLTYTGSAQSPTWNNYDSGKMTLGGTTSGTNAGSYNATFTPKTNYKWADGSTGAKTVAWSIAKAAGSLSLNKTSIKLTAAKTTDTITVTRAGDGKITATSSAPTVASVSVSGGVVTVTAKGKGSATITVSVAAGTNHTAPANKTCSVEVTLPTKVLNDNSWATIREVSSAGLGANYWAVGDVKEIKINFSFTGGF